MIKDNQLEYVSYIETVPQKKKKKKTTEENILNNLEIDIQHM